MRDEHAEARRIKALYATQRKLYRAGYCAIAGIDEVGRGACAGPVTVAACILDRSCDYLEGLDDSKALSPRKRTLLAAKIKDFSVAYTIVHKPNDLIDERGINATLAIAQIECIDTLDVVPDKILIDGIALGKGLGRGEEYVVKGDATVACIAAASILAKVARDQLMIQIAKDDPRYTLYGFAQNKGYGTALHREAIEAHGLLPLHRRTFCTNFTLPSTNN